MQKVTLFAMYVSIDTSEEHIYKAFEAEVFQVSGFPITGLVRTQLPTVSVLINVPL